VHDVDGLPLVAGQVAPQLAVAERLGAARDLGLAFLMAPAARVPAET
jgi:hypothetical protein